MTLMLLQPVEFMDEPCSTLFPYLNSQQTAGAASVLSSSLSLYYKMIERIRLDRYDVLWQTNLVTNTHTHTRRALYSLYSHR